MRSLTALSLSLLIIAGPVPDAASHGVAPHGEEESPAPPAGPRLETLTKQVLEGVEGTEVIVSRVTIPPHTALPKHWHPGEEFAYVIEGALTLWQEGKEDTRFRAGDVGVVPLRQVHTAITGAEGATLIVFRVHAQGQPERVLVE